MPTVYYNSNNSAYEVAQHNYDTLLSSKSTDKNYLLVSKNGKVTPKNLFIYINSLREPLQKCKLATDNLIDYNKNIIEEIRRRNAE